MALGDLTAHITAGNDGQAATYGNLAVDISAGHDIPLVWARGDLHADLFAGNLIDQVVSYGEMHLNAAADEINTVSAWEAIYGVIEALVRIGVVRSGEDILAAIGAPTIDALTANDGSVFATQYPELPAVSLEGVKAFMRGLRRDLLDVQATLEELRAGALRELAADRVAALDGAGPSLGPNERKRASPPLVAWSARGVSWV